MVNYNTSTLIQFYNVRDIIDKGKITWKYKDS